jgi:hypothetical protein
VNAAASGGLVRGADMLGTTLACLVALLDLITIGGSAWGLFKILQDVRLLFLLDEE